MIDQLANIQLKKFYENPEHVDILIMDHIYTQLKCEDSIYGRKK